LASTPIEACASPPTTSAIRVSPLATPVAAQLTNADEHRYPSGVLHAG